MSLLEQLEISHSVVAHPASTSLVPRAWGIPRADCEVAEMLKLDMQQGPWIAGGSAIAWYKNQLLHLPMNRSDDLRHDVDVFFRDKAQFDDTLAAIMKLNDSGDHLVMKKHDSLNAVTLLYVNRNSDKSWKLQLIRKQYFSTARQVVESFDIRACAIATDGRLWCRLPGAISDIDRRHLHFRKFHTESISRLVKYMAYGYTPDAEQIKELFSCPERTARKDTPLGDGYDTF
jgi:hypothetical protein